MVLDRRLQIIDRAPVITTNKSTLVPLAPTIMHHEILQTLTKVGKRRYTKLKSKRRNRSQMYSDTSGQNLNGVQKNRKSGRKKKSKKNNMKDPF